MTELSALNVMKLKLFEAYKKADKATTLAEHSVAMSEAKKSLGEALALEETLEGFKRCYEWTAQPNSKNA